MKETRERNTERPSPKPSDLPQCPIQPFLSAYVSLRRPSSLYATPSRISDSPIRHYFLFNSSPLLSCSYYLFFTGHSITIIYYTIVILYLHNAYGGERYCSLFDIWCGIWRVVSAFLFYFFLFFPVAFSLSLRPSFAQYHTVYILLLRIYLSSSFSSLDFLLRIPHYRNALHLALWIFRYSAT